MSAQPESKPNEHSTTMEKRVAELEENWLRLKWAAGLLCVAVLLVTGYGLIEIPRKAVEQVTPLVKETARIEAEKRIPEAIVNEVQQARDRATAAASTAEGAVQKLETQLGVLPAARYRCTADYSEQVVVGNENGTIINFSERDYDTHDAVKTGKTWEFVTPETGIYSVSAYANCWQGGGSSSAGLTAISIYKRNKRIVYLAQLSPSTIAGTMLGGTTEIELTKGDPIDIRVHASGNAADSFVRSANATWVAISYVRFAAPVRSDR